MTVTIRCLCGHEDRATAFIVCTGTREEKRTDPSGKVRKVRVDTTPPNLWGCPKCKLRWQVTKEGVVPLKGNAEVQAEQRARLRKAWGLAPTPAIEEAWPE